MEFVIDESHPDWAMVRNVPVMNEQLLLVAPASMPFHVKESEGRFPAIDIFELADKPFIVNGNEPFKVALANLFSRIGGSPNVVLECVNPEIAYGMVKEQLGVTFLSELMHLKYPGEDVCFYTLADHPIRRTTSVIYPANRRLSEDAKLFLSVLREVGCSILSAEAQPLYEEDEAGEEEE